MNAKSSFYPAVIFACVLGVVGFLLLIWLQFSVTIEPMGADKVALLPETDQSHQSLSTDAALSSSSVPISTAQPTESDKQDIAQSQSPAKVASIAGALRVSNQTDHPLRVALLLKEPAPTAATKPKYDEPVHWDFAPGEGSTQGLVLSLPEGNLKLKKGDILVAFAQDGSRRYWGPFVVGETDTPVLNRKTSEWQLILQP
jgi:cytoskeletal protein RodZ